LALTTQLTGPRPRNPRNPRTRRDTGAPTGPHNENNHLKINIIDQSTGLLVVFVDRDDSMPFNLDGDHRGPNPFILRHHGPNNGSWLRTSGS
jgi:hypothetical protein